MPHQPQRRFAKSLFAFSLRPSEVILQPELNQPGRDGSGPDHPKAGGPKRRPRSGILNMVQRVEEFRPEFERMSLGHFKHFGDRQVDVILIRSAYDTRATVSIAGSIPYHRYRAESSGIEIVIHAAAYAPRRGDIAVRLAGTELRARCAGKPVDRTAP